MGIRSKNILLTDENYVNEQVASRMLRKFGHEIDICFRGFEAIEAIQTKQLDLVLMDVMMPGMDGITASQEIRRQLGKACPPIIALTAYTNDEDERRCLDAGLDGFLSKPFTIEQLRTCVDTFLERNTPEEPGPLNLPLFQTFLKSMGEDDLDFLDELFSDFLTETNRVRTEIHAGIEEQDLDMISRACHSLKGSAAILGAVSLESISGELEGLASQGKLNDILLRMSHFEGCINAIRSALDEQLGKLILKSQS